MAYNPKSLKAEEFISDEEILATLEYAEQNKQNRELIEEILEKARPKKTENSSRKNDYSPENEPAFLFSAVNRFGCPHTACLGNTYLHESFLTPVHKVVRLPHYEAAAPACRIILPASAFCGAKVSSDNYILFSFFIVKNEGIPYTRSALR